MATPQAARGWYRPPCRHINNQYWLCLRGGGFPTSGEERMGATMARRVVGAYLGRHGVIVADSQLVDGHCVVLIH
jgi:hypothetical protein